LVVLVLTALAVIVFAATVWRITRSVTLSVLAEVATFIVLIEYAGRSPMHPGAMIALLLALLGYALVAYGTDRRTQWLVLAGASLGGLLMLKVNIGVFAIAAVVVSFVIGNRRYPRWFRILVGIGAVGLPFAVISQRFDQSYTVQFATLVSFSVLASLVPLEADEITIAPRSFLALGGALVATVFASCLWPLLTGSSPTRLFHGVVIQPLGQADNLEGPIHSHIQWIAIVVTLAALALVIAVRRRRPRFLDGSPPWLFDVALAVAGLAVLGLGLFGGIGGWLPAIVVLPCLAWLAGSQRKVRLALRFLVPLAILQLLHIYPVPGAQLSWGLVTMCVPCVVALWAGLRPLPFWRSTTPWMRVVAVGVLCVIGVAVADLWPATVWRDYRDATPLSLRGTGFIRIQPWHAQSLQSLARFVHKHCDTFYSAPGIASLYIYADVPAPTGQLANFPGVLDEREQRDIAQQLAGLDAHERVCIVRSVRGFPAWQASSYGNGPLGRAIAPYQDQIGKVGGFTVSLRGPAGGNR
jgi:hypothetical protein